MRIVFSYLGPPFGGAASALVSPFDATPPSFLTESHYIECIPGCGPEARAKADSIRPVRRSLDLEAIHRVFEDRALHPELFRRGDPRPIIAFMRPKRPRDDSTVRERRSPTVEVHSPALPLASSFLNRYCRAEVARLLSDPARLLRELTYRDILIEKTGKDPAEDADYRKVLFEVAKFVEDMLGKEEIDKGIRAKLAPLPLPSIASRTLNPALEVALRQYFDLLGCGGMIEKFLVDRALESGRADETEDVLYRHARSGKFPIVGSVSESSNDFRRPEILGDRQKPSENRALIVDQGGVSRDPEALILDDEDVECRFYFAVKPRYADIFWRRFTAVLNQAQRDRCLFQAKGFLRERRYRDSADPVVLFFRPKDQEYFYHAIVQLIDRLPKEWFHEDLKPPFAAQLLSEGGKPVHGVSVGESPFQAQMSFNERIAKAVMWAVRAEELIRLLGREVTIEDRLQIIAGHLEWFGVDLLNPAFNSAKGNLRAGVERFNFIWTHTDQGRAPRLPDAAGRTPVLYLRAGDGDPLHGFVEGNGRGFVIGRGEECRFSLKESEAVSRTHCEFSVRDGRWYVKDLNSTNGTYVNGTRIYSSIVNDGDIIDAGGRTWRVCLRSPSGEIDCGLLLRNLKILAGGARPNCEVPKNPVREGSLRVQVGTLSLDAAGKIVGIHTRWPFDIEQKKPTKTGMFSVSSFFDAILFDGKLVWHKDISRLNPDQQAAVKALYDESSDARKKMESECPGLLADVLKWLTAC